MADVVYPAVCDFIFLPFFLSPPFLLSLLTAPVEMEQTFIAVKPDGVMRGLCGEIIKRFEAKGFKLVAAKFIQVNCHVVHVYYQP